MEHSQEYSPDNKHDEITLPKRWIDQPHYISDNFTVDIYMDETYEKMNIVPGLKTNLFEHQKTVVKAMIDMELNRRINTNKGLLKFSAGVLSEPVGSGKTIEILSVILSVKIPKIAPDISTIKCIASTSKRNELCGINIIRRSFKTILKPTIIFVGVSVLSQWINTIDNFTDKTMVKYFVVDGVKNLELLIKKISNREINKYTIILVKNGKVTRSVALPEGLVLEAKNKSNTPYIYNIVSNLRNICWTRVVIDDFDTIGLPSNAGFVNGLFTWFISSTRKGFASVKSLAVNYDIQTTSEYLLYKNHGCHTITNNNTLFSCLNVRNNDKFIQATIKITNPKFYVYSCKNQNKQYIEYLDAMGIDEVKNIVEMINSDSLETAAEHVGVKSTSVVDIFQKILGEQFIQYETSSKIVSFIEKHKTDERLPASEIPEDDKYGKKCLLAFRVPKYNYPNLKNIFETTYDEYKKIKEKSGLAIQRVKDNIKHGECPICCIEFSELSDEEAYVIMKCCGVIICSICIFGAVFKDKSIRGICSNCRANATIKNIVYVKSDFNMESVLNDSFEDKSQKEEIAPKEKEKAKEIPKERTKENIIVSIIKGEPVADTKNAEVVVPNLMKGSNEVNFESEIKKVLIFGNYDESLENIKKTIVENKIQCFKLGGTYQEITSTVKKFESSKETSVLLINSLMHCAGLNLQFATDLIYTHRIMDPNIESQTMGRIQRIGRKTTAKIHYVLYENEVYAISGRIRIIN